VRAVLADPQLGQAPKFVLGWWQQHRASRATSSPWCSRSEILGCTVVEQRRRARPVVEAGAGVDWHEFVAWTLAAGPGPAWKTWP
jgi:UDP-N-acetylmuramate dehydrogenase